MRALLLLLVLALAGCRGGGDGDLDADADAFDPETMREVALADCEAACLHREDCDALGGDCEHTCSDEWDVVSLWGGPECIEGFRAWWRCEAATPCDVFHTTDGDVCPDEIAAAMVACHD